MRECMTQEEAMSMSNEQAIQIIKPLRDMMIDQHGCPVSDAVFALDIAIKALEQRWIPCSERLPEYGKTVLWCNDKGSVFTTAITYKNGDSWAVGKRHRGRRMIAWMPLPTPYREEQE